MDVTVHSPVRAEALEFESHSTLLTLKVMHSEVIDTARARLHLHRTAHVHCPG
eukprot:CAMPEP_0202817288 /NCGR_PEP_ID=MMETSP1389-20130828/7543_1 /ASSEMBLY_ACC=CAM_ASM_000865 /TAXON_ID=302021 /ORGANISM="Rhodomonas sp., Strain CCMP768" /LENGTH=52 /DNA_ID=CAMNT_0049489473 /DNA_START=515 /DNA_END=669 /DNA_ORIENTATION=+